MANPSSSEEEKKAVVLVEVEGTVFLPGMVCRLRYDSDLIHHEWDRTFPVTVNRSRVREGELVFLLSSFLPMRARLLNIFAVLVMRSCDGSIGWLWFSQGELNRDRYCVLEVVQNPVKEG